MGYAKVEALERLQSQGLNIFEYTVIDNLYVLAEYRKTHPEFTIRFASEDEKLNLPFYIVRKSTPIDAVLQTMRNAQVFKCVLLCSDGVKYEKSQVANFVFCKTHSGRFMCEYRVGSEPLRDMFKHKTARILGSTYGLFDVWEGYNRYGLGHTNFQRMLQYIADSQIYDKYVECTLYSDPVGIRNEQVICWGYTDSWGRSL